VLTWKAGVDALLFPPDLVKDLHPDEYLGVFGENLPDIREKFRDDVDIFIGSIFELENPETLWKLLRKTDPRIMALYYDRILAANHSLERVRNQKSVVNVPESWDTLSRMLLFQKLFQ